MALVRHWKVVLGGVGVYCVGLAAFVVYYRASVGEEQRQLAEAAREGEAKRWEDAKNAGQSGSHAAPHSPPSVTV